MFGAGLMFGETREFDPREVNFGRIATCYVAEGSSGAAAGFQKCDTIESIDGTPIHILEDVRTALVKAQRGRREAIIEVKRLVGPKGRSFFSYSGLSLPIDEVRWAAVSP